MTMSLMKHYHQKTTSQLGAFLKWHLGEPSEQEIVFHQPIIIAFVKFVEGF